MLNDINFSSSFPSCPIFYVLIFYFPIIIFFYLLLIKYLITLIRWFNFFLSCGWILC